MKLQYLSSVYCIVFAAVFFAATAAGPLGQEKSVLGIALGTLMVYPPDVNRYLTQVESPLNAPLFPRRLLLAHGVEVRLEFRPLPFLDLTPWIAGMYSARRFRSVSVDFFVPDIRVPVVIRLADVSTGLRVQFGGYLAAEKLRLRGGVSISEHFTRLHVIENIDHELTALGPQFSFTAGCQFRLFDRVFFDLEADLPVNSLPLRVTKGSSFALEKLTGAAPLPNNVYLMNLTLRPEVRINLKKKRLPDVL